MSVQLPLAFTVREASLEARFRQFHAEHPEVYTALVRLARDAKRAGWDRIGVGMLWERMRWEMMFLGRPRDSEGWKLNNSYRSRYARLLMAQEPDLSEIFELRELKT